MSLYKGRLPDQSVPLMDALNRSLPFDIRLLPYDVATNRAWAAELCRQGIFSQKELADVHAALADILGEFQAGRFEPPPEDEDVHSLVERLLTERLGPTGAKIHTGRSRNDQVVCDLRLFTVANLKGLVAEVLDLIEVLAQRGVEHRETLMAGTTHLQPALPLTLGHFFFSLAFALVRDCGRLNDALSRANACPLGAGALAGSGLPVDRAALARDLGFSSVLPNSVDAISDRDFCQETASACALLGAHLSRYAEELIIWANPAFGFVRFADAWSTGSSMMPQKRNPDAMELVRGKCARLIGATTALLTLTKGLPLTYAKDLQEDKQPLFDVLDTSSLVVQVFRESLASAVFSPERLAAALSGEMLATDLADALARVGVPFRQAHERVGQWVSEMERAGGFPAELDADAVMKRFPELKEKPPALDFHASVSARVVEGGTAPVNIDRQAGQISDFIKWQRVELGLEADA